MGAGGVVDDLQARERRRRGQNGPVPRRALALFGHGEAGLFLWSLRDEGYGAGWRIRESRCGELVSVLCGPCANAERVVLDPLPAMVADGTAALASVDRASFLASLLATDGTAGGPDAVRRLGGRHFRRRRRGVLGKAPGRGEPDGTQHRGLGRGRDGRVERHRPGHGEALRRKRRAWCSPREAKGACGRPRTNARRPAPGCSSSPRT